MNILFVCTGNTCRSPAAEGIFKFLIKDDDKLKNIKAESAGLTAEIGAAASVNSVKVCMEDYGIDISSHKSRQLTENIIENTDLFVCMTMGHAQALMGFGVPKNKIYVLDVSDPYGGNIGIYRQCCRQIYEKLQKLAELIRRKYPDGI